MGERRGGLQSGRDTADLVGDAVMSSLADLVERLHEDPPAAPVENVEPVPAAASGTSARRLSPRAPADAVADLVGTLVAAIVPVVLSRIDLNEVLDRVDVQAVVDRVDVHEVVGRIDLDELVSRIDVDAVLARVDIDAVVRRIDLTAATREAMEAIDIGELVRESTATIGSDVVEDLRAQSMRADDLIARLFDALLRRKGPRRVELDPR